MARRNSFVQSGTRFFNPLMLRLAGTPILPLYGVIKHRGRRSGKLFATPVVVWRIEGGFLVPMPWGDQTDWYRNVHAAGGCMIHWRGHDFSVVDPQLVDLATAASTVPAAQRRVMGRFGIRQCLRVRAMPVDVEAGRHYVRPDT